MEKFCPESCCVVGNHYSLKGKHERAVLYFQRAIKLNSRFVLPCVCCALCYREPRPVIVFCWYRISVVARDQTAHLMFLKIECSYN